MSFWATAGQMGAQLGLDLWGENRQQQREKELMGLEHGYDKAMLNLGHDKQFEMWQKTSFPAQLEMMRKAGLSPGLMYKQGGSPGQTGSQTGSSSASGNAPKFNPMDVAQISLVEAQRKKLAAETKEIDSRVPVNEAQTRKIGAEFKNISKDTIKKIQEISNLKTLDEWNMAKRDLETLKFNKQVTGSFAVDLMTQMGLDPINNIDDRDQLRGLIYLWFGARVGSDIANALSKLLDIDLSRLFPGKKNKGDKGFTMNSTLD